MKTTIGAVAFLVLAVGCGPGNVFHGDLAFSEGERTVIEEAAATMAERTGGEPVVIVWDGDVGAGEQRILRRRPPSPTADGQLIFSTENVSRSLYVLPELEEPRLRAVAEHEWGHWYGLSHLPEGESGLMARGASGSWGEADVAECRRHDLCAY